MNKALTIESSDRDVSSFKIYKEGTGVLKLEDALNEKTRNRAVAFCSAIMDKVTSDPSYHTRTRAGVITYDQDANELSVYLKYTSRGGKRYKDESLSLLFKESDFSENKQKFSKITTTEDL